MIPLFTSTNLISFNLPNACQLPITLPLIQLVMAISQHQISGISFLICPPILLCHWMSNIFIKWFGISNKLWLKKWMKQKNLKVKKNNLLLQSIELHCIRYMNLSSLKWLIPINWEKFCPTSEKSSIWEFRTQPTISFTWFYT